MSESLEIDQQACNYQTFRHIERVRNYLTLFIKELLERGELHDQSKLESPEVELFTEHTPKLAGLTFGSEEYEKCREDLAPALDHHYANNRHHPEFHKEGVDDMNLVDLIEMLADWKASSERQNDGNLRKSLDENAERFKMSPQLTRILENTIKELF